MIGCFAHHLTPIIGSFQGTLCGSGTTIIKALNGNCRTFQDSRAAPLGCSLFQPKPASCTADRIAAQAYGLMQTCIWGSEHRRKRFCQICWYALPTALFYTQDSHKAAVQVRVPGRPGNGTPGSGCSQ